MKRRMTRSTPASTKKTQELPHGDRICSQSSTSFIVSRAAVIRLLLWYMAVARPCRQRAVGGAVASEGSGKAGFTEAQTIVTRREEGSERSWGLGELFGGCMSQ